jgi:signal transduction histidine kinase
MSEPKDEHDAAQQVAAGALASGVASELIAPLREVRDGLAVVIATLDHHFAEARGPSPLPFAEAKALREKLAEMYVVQRGVTRQTADLARAIAPQRASAEPVDLNQVVEQALALARHEIGATELSFDAGELPTVRAVPGELVLLAARLISAAAMAARQSGGELSVATVRRGGEAGDEIVLTVRHAGGAAADVSALAIRVLGPLGGRLSAIADGGEVGYELVVPVR